MATTIQKPFTPRVAYHPGVTLAEKLEELGMSVKEFALRVTKPEKTIIGSENSLPLPSRIYSALSSSVP